MSDARKIIADITFTGRLFGVPIDFPLGEEKADAILAALALAGFVITTRERWDALVRVAEGIERVVASKAMEGSE